MKFVCVFNVLSSFFRLPLCHHCWANDSGSDSLASFYLFKLLILVLCLSAPLLKLTHSSKWDSTSAMIHFYSCLCYCELQENDVMWCGEKFQKISLCRAGGPVVWDVCHVCQCPRFDCSWVSLLSLFVFPADLHCQQFNKGTCARTIYFKKKSWWHMPNTRKLHCDEDQCTHKHWLTPHTSISKIIPLTLRLWKSNKNQTLSFKCYSLTFFYCTVGCFCISVHPVGYTLITWVCHSQISQIDCLELKHWYGNTEFHVVWPKKLKCRDAINEHFHYLLIYFYFFWLII